ncbi:hypothetical protein LS66_002800 [Helicobacter sp. MIT 03-1614]|uniref:hypothetical protein n=1 Tax=Helicobacter sp. MIT 03-1614 TaxID=1548147 RepID=UPI000512E484|nr:hypothetical protein [Helicobacter sp. MIT 03-1614]TLD90416.1 hypothetical protein LS66_002800 [Helicobacter sp. MIT 03-1614]
MKAYINENLASSVLDCILNFYVANPYVLIGCGNGGVWQNREFLSTQSAINRALEMISSCKRLQNLVLIAPLTYSLENLAFLHTQGVLLDIYVGQKDENALVILQSCSAFGVVRFYKNISFTHCIK